SHQRHPHFSPVAHQPDAVKIAWCNSNHYKWIAVDQHLASDCVPVTCKTTLPAIVAKNNNGIGATAAVVILLKQPAERRFHAQQTEVVFADNVGPKEFGARADSYTEIETGLRGNGLKNLALTKLAILRVAPITGLSAGNTAVHGDKL